MGATVQEKSTRGLKYKRLLLIDPGESTKGDSCLEGPYEKFKEGCKQR